MSNGYDQEMYQELYAIRTEMTRMVSLLDQIYREIVGLRNDLKREQYSRTEPDVEKQSYIPRGRFSRGDER